MSNKRNAGLIRTEVLKNLYEISKKNLCECDEHFDGKLQQLQIEFQISIVGQRVFYIHVWQKIAKGRINPKFML